VGDNLGENYNFDGKDMSGAIAYGTASTGGYRIEDGDDRVNYLNLI